MLTKTITIGLFVCLHPTNVDTTIAISENVKIETDKSAKYDLQRKMAAHEQRTAEIVAKRGA